MHREDHERTMRDRLRLPSIRNPQSFWDILGISLIGLFVVAVELYISRAWIIRREVVVLMAIVFIWDAWAALQILGKQIES